MGMHLEKFNRLSASAGFLSQGKRHHLQVAFVVLVAWSFSQSLLMQTPFSFALNQKNAGGDDQVPADYERHDHLWGEPVFRVAVDADDWRDGHKKAQAKNHSANPYSCGLSVHCFFYNHKSNIKQTYCECSKGVVRLIISPDDLSTGRVK
jgi:hypothetical protein